MNDDDDNFVERLRNREIARTDQREAQDKKVKDQESGQQTIRESARTAFDDMRSCFEDLVEQANAKLTEKFVNFPVPSGFGIQLGNRTVSFTYATPFLANEGVPHVIVTFQTLASAFGFFPDAFDKGEFGTEKWELEPTWDDRTSSLRWSEGESTRSSSGVVRDAIEALQAGGD